MVLVLVLLLVRFSIPVLLIPVHSVWIPSQSWHSKFLVLVLFLAGSPAGTKPLKEDQAGAAEEDAKEEEEQAGAADEELQPDVDDHISAEEEVVHEVQTAAEVGGRGGL